MNFDTQPARPDGWLQPHNLYWLALLSVTAVLCIPILSVHYPALVDYPNHLARAYIIYHYHDTPIFQQNYQLRFIPIPNLALDIIIPLLLHWFSLFTAGKIFLTLTVILFVAGCHFLGKAAHGQPTWLALPCAFFVYCSMFLWGFLNFMFGLALFSFCVAFWLQWRARWNVLHLLGATLLVCLTYVAHLEAYAFASAAIGIMTLWHMLNGKVKIGDAVLGLLPLVPPSLVFALYMRRGGSVGPLRWSTLAGKVAGGLSLILSYDRRIDILLIVGMLVIFFVFVWRVEGLRVVDPLFVAGLVFFLLYLITPNALFTGDSADQRFFPPAVLLLVLSLKIDMRQRTAEALLLAWLALSTIRVISIRSTWRQLDKNTAAVVAMMSALPEGARVYPATSLDLESKLERSLHHVILYATVYRHAFVPTLFASESLNPVLFRRQVDLREPGAPGWATPLKDYDFVYSYVVPMEALRDLERCCAPIANENGLTLWRVRKEDASGTNSVQPISGNASPEVAPREDHAWLKNARTADGDFKK